MDRRTERTRGTARGGRNLRGRRQRTDGRRQQKHMQQTDRRTEVAETQTDRRTEAAEARTEEDNQGDRESEDTEIGLDT